MQLNFKCPDCVIEELDKYVDGVRYPSRACLITVILNNWIASQPPPGERQKKKMNKFVLRIPGTLLTPLDEIRESETSLSRNQFILGILRDYLAQHEFGTKPPNEPKQKKLEQYRR